MASSASIQVLGEFRWHALPEVSFSEWGERGSIDVLGAHDAGFGVVVEVKSDIGSTEEMNRSLDVKARLAPKLIEERFGIRVTAVGRLLVLPDQMRLRRLADRYATTLDALYPARGREVRRWLRHPSGHVNGLWFASFGGKTRHRAQR